MRKLYLALVVLSCFLLFTTSTSAKEYDWEQSTSLLLSGTVENVTCNGGNDGSIDITVPGGTPPYSYSWSTGATIQDLNNLTAGVYSVTVTDANGITESESFTITEPDPLTISVASTGANCNANNGSATVTASGGTPPYSYLWSTGETSANESSLGIGTYFVVVTDDNGCSVTQQVNISNASNQPFTAVFVINPVTCDGGSNGSATVEASLGGNTYLWSNGATTQTVTGLSEGWYTVTVTHPNTCSITFSVYISAPDPITLSPNTIVSNVSCNGGNDGSATATITGGNPPYSYSWDTNPVQTSPTISGLSAGTYAVTVTDSMGCVGTDTVTITEPPALVATITSATPASCTGSDDGSATVTASGGVPGYAYSWNTDPVQTTATATGLGASGPFTVNVTDANGCTTSASVSLNTPTLLLATISSTNASCNGYNDGSAAVSVSGGTPGYTYSWNTTPTDTTSMISGVAAGTYMVTVTDSNNCIVTASVTITEPAPLTATISSVSGVSCFGNANGWATVDVSGGTPAYFFNWSTNPAQVTATANGLAGGSYTVTVTDINNCSTTASVTITEPPMLTASITSFSNTLCNNSSDGSATVTAGGGTPGYLYSWSAPNQFTATASGLTAGNYTVTVTDANNCMATASVSITEPAEVTATITASTPASCMGNNDGTATVSGGGGTPGYTYSWNSTPVQTTSTANGLAAGSYTVIVTDANNCSDSATVSITQPTTLETTITTINASCNGGSDGAATVNATGGSGSYTYSWNTNPVQTTSTATGLSAGSYTVTVTDSNNCMVLSPVTIIEPSPLTAILNSITDATCYGSEDGSATVSVSGGTPGYTYSWNTNPVQNTATATGLATGSYTVTVRDSNNCTTTVPVIINQPQPLVLNTTASDYNGYGILCNGNSDGWIALSATGGVPSYNCTWTGPNGFTSTNFTITDIPGGTYSVTLIDSNGCSANTSITLSSPPALTTTITSATVAGGYNIGCNGDLTGNINLEVTGGIPNYSFNWSGPNGFSSLSEDHSNLGAGVYSVTAIDANGCIHNDSITLTEPAILDLSTSTPVYAGGYNISCNGTTTGSINTAVTGGTAGYSYNWSGPNGFTSGTGFVNNLYAGTYTLTITDANGCLISDTITLSEPQPMQLTSIIAQYNGNNISCNGANDGSIDISVTGGVAAYSFSWNGPSGFSASTEDVSMLYAGNYQVTATDSNGCFITSSFTLTEPAGVVTVASVQSPLCNGNSNGAIDVSASGGVTPYTFAWSNGGTTEDLTGITAGLYTLTLTDANGCSTLTTVNVTEPTAISSTTMVTGASCAAASNGSINATVSGGSMPYSYSWSNGGTTEDISGLSGNTYTLTITDANGCINVLTATVPVLYELGVTLDVLHVGCFGGNTGAIDLSMVQGTSPFTFAWSNGSANEDLSNVSAGTYSVTVVDASGCSTTETVTINQSDLLSSSITSPLTFSGHNLSGYQSNDGTIDLTVNGGTVPYTFAWSNGETQEDLSGLAAGTYSVTVTDSNGCTVIASITLDQPLILEMPTGFSPNGDGANDYFVVHGIEAFPDNTLIVFNRWGNKVFEQNGYNNDWSGRNNEGEELPDGTYFVILKVNNTDITLSGYVDLRRH